VLAVYVQHNAERGRARQQLDTTRRRAAVASNDAALAAVPTDIHSLTQVERVSEQQRELMRQWPAGSGWQQYGPPLAAAETTLGRLAIRQSDLRKESPRAMALNSLMERISLAGSWMPSPYARGP